MASEHVELRGPCPREIVDVIDAVSTAERISRTDLVNRVLKVWAMGRIHEAMLVQRLTRGNPALRETGWGDLELPGIVAKPTELRD